MKLKGITFSVAGAEWYEARGLWLCQVILWGKGNRSLFALWKDDTGLTLDLFWVRI